MTAPVAAPVHANQLAPLLEKWFGPEARGQAIAVRYDGLWEGPDELQVGDTSAAVRECRSELEARDEFLHADRTKHLVLLCKFDHLSSDLSADLFSPSIRRLNAWDALLAIFGVSSVDAPLTRELWLADALLASAPPGTSYRRGVSRQLDSERAWQTFFKHRLQFDPAEGLEGLLRWTMTAAATALATRPPAEQQGTQRELAKRIPGSSAVVTLTILGEPQSALPLGLAARTVVDGTASEARGEARAGLKTRVPGWSISDDEVRHWNLAAESVVTQLLHDDPATAGRLLAQGEREVALLNAEGLTGNSPVMRSGLKARVAQLVEAISAWRDGNGSAAAVTAAANHVAAHAIGDETDVATTAARLARWLDGPSEPAGHLLAAARAYAEDQSYADSARTALRQRPSTSAMDGEILAVLELADERRRGQDRVFAELLAREQAQPTSDGSILGVEQLLDRVVAPLALEQPVLLIVLDGLSHRVATELSPSLAVRGWTELRRNEHPDRALVLSVLPSVTAASRTSLLVGSLVRGAARNEAKAFAQHPALRAVDPKGTEPVLFHKATLSDGRGLATEVTDEIVGDRQVVGVVVNAVDDHLARSEQVAINWSLDSIMPLGALLDTARDAGRLVVIASDHGHVLDRRGAKQTQAPGESGERWRQPGGDLAEGEIEIAGPRVLRSDQRCVLAWDETVRYALRKNGYHGGANPQEVLAPLLVLAAGAADPIAGWTPANDVPPAWWNSVTAPVFASPVPVQERPRAKPSKSTPASADVQLSLTDDVGVTDHDWVDDLLASDVFAEQRAMAGRAALDNERLTVLLHALAANGGTLLLDALSQATGWSTARLPGILATTSRLLNVEGYPILTTDPAARTVTLDLPTLRRQFGLGDSA